MYGGVGVRGCRWVYVGMCMSRTPMSGYTLDGSKHMCCTKINLYTRVIQNVAQNFRVKTN